MRRNSNVARPERVLVRFAATIVSLAGPSHVSRTVSAGDSRTQLPDIQRSASTSAGACAAAPRTVQAANAAMKRFMAIPDRCDGAAYTAALHATCTFATSCRVLDERGGEPRGGFRELAGRASDEAPELAVEV